MKYDHYVGLCLRFSTALFKLYSRTHGRKLSQERVQARLDICYTCEHFTGRRCNICGCCTDGRVSLFNKLAYPTERCPADPPRWLEE